MSKFTLPNVKPGESADRIRFTFEVTKGQHAGKEASALTDTKLTSGNRTGRIISGMAGRELQPAENVTALVESFVGKSFMVTVGPGPKGGKPQVQTVTPPPEM